jgi:heme oxygenase (biliverdin-producing, ferredoxin)
MSTTPPDAATHAAADAQTLAARLRAETKRLHTQAERSGVMGALLRGACPRPAYAALIASLTVIYEALERQLEAHAAHPALAPLRLPGLARYHTLRADGEALAVLDAHHADPAEEARAYAAHLDRLGTEDPALLIAHAWLRYLGDLNGGQIVGRIVRESLGLSAAVTTFYDFPALSDPHAAAAAWRAALDTLPLDAETQTRIVDEACAGFHRHIALFVTLLPPAQDAAESSAA